MDIILHVFTDGLMSSTSVHIYISINDSDDSVWLVGDIWVIELQWWLNSTMHLLLLKIQMDLERNYL